MVQSHQASHQGDESRTATEHTEHLPTLQLKGRGRPLQLLSRILSGGYIHQSLPESPVTFLCYVVIDAAVNASQLPSATAPGHSTGGLAAGSEATGDAACVLEPVIVG